LNLRLDGASSPGDQTGNDAMSEAQHYHVFETAMGFCAIAWGDAGVLRFHSRNFYDVFHPRSAALGRKTS